jgi:hypothetical protein
VSNRNGNRGRDDAQTMERERWHAHMRVGGPRLTRADLLEAGDVPGELVESLNILPLDVEDAGRWYRHLRDLYKRAIEEDRPHRHLRNELEVQHYRAKLEELRGRDRLLLHDLARVKARCYKTGDDKERLPALADVQGETQWLAKRLGIEPMPPTGWDQSFGGADSSAEWDKEYLQILAQRAREVSRPHRPRPRGPDLEPRKQRRPAPRPLTATPEQKAAAKLELRIVRIVQLLRKHPDGLSANAVRKKLRMGRDQLEEARKAGLASKRIGERGSVENPRYFVASNPIRKSPRKRPPH